MRESIGNSDNEILAKKALSSIIGQFFLWSIAFLSIQSHGISPWSAIILTVLISLNVVRLVLVRRSGLWGSQSAWYRLYAVTTLGTAVCWGALECFYLAANGLGDETSILLLIINAGVVAAATAGLSPDKKLARIFVTSILAPLTLTLIFVVSVPHYYVAGVLVLYNLFLFAQIEVQSNILLKLRDREEQVRAIVDATLEAIVIHRDEIVLDCNPAFTRMFGLPLKEVVGRSILSFTPPEDRPANVNNVGKSETQYLRGLRADGSSFPAEVYGRWFTFKGEKVRVTCIQDISDRVAVEEGLRENVRQVEAMAAEREKLAAESMKSRTDFLANMSHELRTPLNAIIGLSDLLDSTPDRQTRRRYLKIIKSSGESLLQLINDVLDFTKIEGDKIELESIPFSLAELVEGQAELVMMRASDKGTGLFTELDPDLPSRVSGDFGRLGQILLNLLSNAVKFTDMGKVQVRCRKISETDEVATIRFEVIDSGIGISEEQAAKLFRPFTQADSSTSRKHGGTGLGLSISKTLIERMGGKISLESQIGKGTTFWFEVPLAILDRKPISATYSKPAKLQSRIVIVGDELEASEIIGKYLGAWGFPFVHTKASELVTGDAKKGDLICVALSALSPELIVSLYRARASQGARIIAVDTKGLYHRNPDALIEPDLIDRWIASPVKQSELFNAIVDTAGVELLAQDEDKKPQSNSGTEAVDFAQARVLLAEDNSTNQMLTLTILRRIGIRAQAVVNGREAVEAWQTGKYDLVLMDCQMPEMDGFEATMEIRRLELTSGRRIPIIALTANVFDSDREKCFASGMDAFMAKPIRRHALIDELRKFLGDREVVKPAA